MISIMLKTFAFMERVTFILLDIYNYNNVPTPLQVLISYLDIHTICHPLIPSREGRIGLIINDLLGASSFKCIFSSLCNSNMKRTYFF